MKRKIKLDKNTRPKVEKKSAKKNENLSQGETELEKEKNKISSQKPRNSQKTLDFFGVKVPKANKEEKFPEMPEESMLKICSWNVNGIRAVIKKGDLQYFIKQEQPDILCLNETKIDQISLREEKIEFLFNKEFLTYWNFSKTKKGYSGVAIFSKYKPTSVTYDINVPEHDQEGRVITIEYKKFFLVCVYVPNSGLERLKYRTSKWDVSFREYICKLKKNNKPIIIAGDLNVCHQPIDLFDHETRGKAPPFTDEEREGFSSLLKVGFVDSFREINKEKVEYSWFGGYREKADNLGLRIDYILVSEDIKDKINNSLILKKYPGSDHVPIELKISI